MKLQVKQKETLAEVYVDGKHFANLYRLDKGFGRKQIKDGEWVINMAGMAIDGGYFFPPVSYPELKLAVGAIAKVLPW